MESKIYKSLIVLIGIGLTYFKYNINQFLDVEYIMLIITLLIVLFISAIYMLNKKVYDLKVVVFNEKVKSLLTASDKTTVDKNFTDKTESTKSNQVKTNKALVLFIWLLIATGFGTLLGFYFKTFNSKALLMAMRKNTKWESETYLNWLESRVSFFELGGSTKSTYGGFDFNWISFFLGFLAIATLYILLEKTKLVSILKSKIKPYLK